MVIGGTNSYIYGQVARRIDQMTSYSVTDAKNRLSSLIDKALEGEEVVITRRGKPVVEMKSASTRSSAPREIHAWRQARRRARPGVGLTSVEILDLLYQTHED